MNETILAYQSLFPYRQGTKLIETMDQLSDSIRIELLDELTHPRVRKSADEKLQIAFDRIDRSSLISVEKEGLKKVYEAVYQSVNS
ncbi:hypothetical protein MHH33_10075 [Paenisporosarcina sp. FSL H8-0542]|uniref:hypothetical protein n=1 Tax=unclassified Paenisporosarcina TaxID=2642018 RepID=UPI00034E0C6D|nr:hypothetical protein [Paenisporosarcina sp. HGH0030]EPD53085.1 hypothetical protein HMPREF1210_00816 [Paenisporosarcina sp. HGH0030]